jgi:hypothetical protein
MMVADGNAERFAAKPVAGGGTPTSDWIAWDRRFREIDLSACPGLMVVAPNPDDETLGCGVRGSGAVRPRPARAQPSF